MHAWVDRIFRSDDTANRNGAYRPCWTRIRHDCTTNNRGCPHDGAHCFAHLQKVRFFIRVRWGQVLMKWNCILFMRFNMRRRDWDFQCKLRPNLSDIGSSFQHVVGAHQQVWKLRSGEMPPAFQIMARDRFECQVFHSLILWSLLPNMG